jgi:anti-sigma-K factor RskA
MSTLSRDEVKDMLPAYALGALDADERRAVENGLTRYPDLRAELASLASVAHGLSASVPQRAPPAALKAQLLAQAQAQAQAQAAAQPASTPTLTWWQRFIDALSNSSLTPKLAVAALLLSAAFVVVQVLMQLPQGMAQLTAQRQLQTIAATGSETVQLNGTQNAPGAVATIRFNPDDKVGALNVNNLARLPADQSYQLWLVNAEGKRWSGAVFNTAQSGDSLVLVKCPTPMGTIVRFGVSIEPAGGSKAPTGPGVLRSVQS